MCEADFRGYRQGENIALFSKTNGGKKWFFTTGTLPEKISRSRTKHRQALCRIRAAYSSSAEYLDNTCENQDAFLCWSITLFCVHTPGQPPCPLNKDKS
ncbi:MULTISPECIES: hypothetical protein [unclassified Desulfovibrio]|uniref:hypothetical protein n=1 Tax=unclassified Desulfovibrio TaxID=2593640 RepID=UPI002FD9DB63